MVRALIITVVALSITSCKAPFSENEVVARDELLSLAPIGSDARDVKPQLEDKGFECDWNEDQYFAGLKGRKDYLYCDQSVLVVPLIVRRWQLALVHESYVVKNAKVNIDLTGPLNA